jgi:alkyl sulfatase BDS1-like metallo-beta-lactamase superfamily hydrolase
MFPLSNRERSGRLIEMAGGVDAILTEAEQAMADEDFQWAAELTDYVLTADENHRDARLLKSRALRALGAQQISANARNWYLSSAAALESAANQ